MASPYHRPRGRQPFGPSATEIERSKARVALSEAEQWSQHSRNRRLWRELRRLQHRFERFRAAIRSLEADAEARKELRKDVAEAFEQVMKFFSTRDVQQAIPAEATKVVRTAQDLRGQFNAICEVRPATPVPGVIAAPRHPGGHAAATPAVAPIIEMVVVLTWVVAQLKGKTAR
jgi:hypothetical protein